MVYEMSTREKIFKILSESEEVLSGERISEKIGISRVSVWKHIKALVNTGIPISTSTKGYILDSEADSLNPLNFGDRKELIHYYSEITSTMDLAVDLARQGCPGSTVVVADRQTNGRGRMAREWISEEGGLYFTMVVRPDIPIDQAHLMNLAAAVEMNNLLRSSYDIDSWLKWPNDILVEGSKICGLLSQMEMEGGLVEFLTIGVGLNVNNTPDSKVPGATSLKNILGCHVPRKDLLANFIGRFETRLESFDPSALIDDWKEYNNTIGKKVAVVTQKKTFEGTALDIDDQGGLIIEGADGVQDTVVYGDCFYH